MIVQRRLDDFYVSCFFLAIIVDRYYDVRRFFRDRFFEVEEDREDSFIIELAGSLVIRDRAEAARLQRSFIDRDFMGEESIFSFLFSLFEVLVRERCTGSRFFILSI